MIAAVIPTRYNPPELGTLLAGLAGDNVQAHVLRSDDHDHRIYRMWNEGLDTARRCGASEVAILNDDIAILPGTLPLLATVLRSEPDLGVVYPDVNAPWQLPNVPLIEDTTGTWGPGGMTGFCFLFRAELPVRFDEGYHWWYGDDAFERDVRSAGFRVARVRGVPIRHSPDGSARRDWDRLGPLVAEDRARWEALA